MLEIKHVKKNDIVQVMNGKEKGKTGKVLRVIHKSRKVVVERLNMVKRHSRPMGTKPGGIIEQEAAIAASNVQKYCEKCNKGVRIKYKVADGGKRARICFKCSAPLDKAKTKSKSKAKKADAPKDKKEKKE